jgi:hypothetical protein
VADDDETAKGVDAADPHENHDLERIAALLDADLPPADRMAGEAMAAACPECARLRDDLFALAGAAAAMPTPERTRDFRLTTADAARLAPIRWGEPSADATRLTDDMFDPRFTADHPAHDTMLVAALADHSIPTVERDAAQRLVDACRSCAELHVDLLALRTATRALPTPPRPKDYYLSADDADRLRPSGLRRWIVAIGTSRDAVTRPLAIGLTTLGIVGLLVSSAPLVSFGGSASSAASGTAPEAAQPAASQPATDVAAPAPSAARGAAGAGAPAMSSANADAAASAPPAPVPAPGVLLPGPPAPSAVPANGSPPEFLGDQGVANGGSSGAKAPAQVPGRNQPDQPVAASGAQPTEPGSAVPPVVVVSGVLLVAGLGLFVLRRTARRIGT